MSNSLWRHGLYSPWNSSGQNTGVGNHTFLQGIFPTQGLNPGLHCRRILYQLNHLVSPRGLKASAFSLLEPSLLEVIHHRVRSLAFPLQSPCEEHVWRGHMEKRLGTEVEWASERARERKSHPTASAIPGTFPDDSRQSSGPRSVTVCLADRSYDKKERNFRKLTSEFPDSKLEIRFSVMGFVFWRSGDKAWKLSKNTLESLTLGQLRRNDPSLHMMCKLVTVQSQSWNR